MPPHVNQVLVPAHVAHAKQTTISQARSLSRDITAVTVAASGSYRFRTFDGPTRGIAAATVAGTGTNMNGIANSGTAVGTNTGNSGTSLDFTADPLKSRTTRILHIKSSTTAVAYGINSAGTVVGSDGNASAFSLSSRGALKTFIPTGGKSATAFGINDQGTIVGQYVTSTAAPGFIRVRGKHYVAISSPSGQNIVSAQGINNKGRVVGFFVGTNGQDQGFTVNARGAKHGTLTGTAVADPTIPQVAGEPGATLVFSQILGINDKGMVVGYYGDSTGSQHGFLYNTKTGQYTFVVAPGAAFHNGVEVTQITGITNSSEITGFYSDASGVFHGFVATPHRA
jgi:probable HAF family extracellular repeat protein